MSVQQDQNQNSEQLDLPLREEGPNNPRIESYGLLSKTYISRHLSPPDGCSSNNEASTAYETVKKIWHERADALRRRNEAFNCNNFIEPVLKELGWCCLPEQSMPAQFTSRKVPDYCLFTTESDFSKASSADSDTILRYSASVLEAKRWNHPLDRLSNEETPGLFPSQQIQDYLNCAKDNEGNHYFHWAILTNGAEWRLYTDKSSPGAYFSFFLVHQEQLCSIEDFEIFFTLFRSAAFDTYEDGTCFLDAAREQSLTTQTELENNLKKRIFGVLEEVGSAFVDHQENDLSEEDLPLVYEKSLIFLYRLLFVLYAESRGLLPVQVSGAGSNRRYRNEFSLSRLTNRLRDRSIYSDNAFSLLYEELLRLFNLVNGTHPRKNHSLGVTRYNGGLFNPRNHHELEK